MWALLAAVLLAGSAALEPPGALRCRHERCRYIGHFDVGDVSKDFYEVEDNTIQILISDEIIDIDCDGASVLESPALPRAESVRDVWRVTLDNCPLPAARSLADTLSTLNLRYCEPVPWLRPGTICNLRLENMQTTPALTAKHLTSLERTADLILWSDARVSPERGFLAPLRNLDSLVARNVTLPVGLLDELPLLRNIELHYTGVERLHSSHNLTKVIISSESPVDAGSVTPELYYLQLKSPATTLWMDAAPALEELLLDNWVEPLPPPLARCDKLRELHLTAPAMRALPDGWLANCTRLEVLVIVQARHLTALPPTLLTEVYGLTHLAFRDGALETLPGKLLENKYKLKSLELDSNRLRTLPSELTHVYFMEKVNLSSNDLDASALDVFPTHEYYLAEMDLAHNPRIRHVCGTSGFSGLRSATSLKTLILRGTGVTRICRDWREEMPRLELLDLSGNNVTELSFEDLQFTRTVKSEVRLLGAPVGAVRVTREDYSVAASAPPSFTEVHLDVEFPCDCRMYWVRRALDPSLHALDGIRQLRCAGGGLLRDVPLEDMVCARPEECAAAELPPACACAVWADDDPDHDPRLVRVRCENTSLTRVPRLHPRNDSTERLYKLQLAHNHIAELNASDLPDNIRGLDLRNNSLSRVDEETAIKLSEVSGKLWLAGNPLECDCSAEPLLHALLARTGDSDLKKITCPDGSKLHQVSNVDCPQSKALVAWLSGVFVALVALMLAIMIFLSSRSRRFFALAVLHRWGCVWRAAEPKENESRRYDAFVTFSHMDSGVVRELMARLEPPYRLCVHHRDWIPGQYIAEQVVESVRESRRTVALVSRHFLASKWARAEFREAHTAAMLDARPRLLVVLLEEPAALPLDKELQRYIATQTYLRWGDPWFWDKMAVALPPPRPASPPPSTVSRQLFSTSATVPAPELSALGDLAMVLSTDSGS